MFLLLFVQVVLVEGDDTPGCRAYVKNTLQTLFCSWGVGFREQTTHYSHLMPSSLICGWRPLEILKFVGSLALLSILAQGSLLPLNLTPVINTISIHSFNNHN